MDSRNAIDVACSWLMAMGVGLLIAHAATLGAAEPQIEISVGKGEFELVAGARQPAKPIAVDYYLPKRFTKASRVLLVLPGAGRNAAEYRDAWIAASERYGVLILSPRYSEEVYAGIEKYNLAGMIGDLKRDPTVAEGATYKIINEPQEWIFGDFDRIFLRVRERLKFKTERYDVFGHSAGAQVAHRLALFFPSSKADRVVAANSGWYTVPTLTDKFPYGVGEGFASVAQLKRAFSRQLVVMLGEKDDENETRGDLMRTPRIDVQGSGRIQRGKYFYEAATATARQLDIPLRWSIVIVPDVGHDFRKMSEAAAELLYGSAPGVTQ